MRRLLLLPVFVLTTAPLLRCTSFSGTNAPMSDAEIADAAVPDGDTRGDAESLDGAASDGPGADPASCKAVVDDGFERMDVQGGPWADPSVINGCSLKTVTTTPGAGSRSLEVGVGTLGGHAYLAKDLEMRDRVRLRFMIRADVTTSPRMLTVNGIDLPEEGLSLAFVVNGGDVLLCERQMDDGSQQQYAAGTADGFWHSYSMDLDLKTKKVIIERDTVLVAATTLKFDFAPGHVVARVGVSRVESLTAATFWTDRIVICDDP